MVFKQFHTHSSISLIDFLILLFLWNLHTSCNLLLFVLLFRGRPELSSFAQEYTGGGSRSMAAVRFLKS